MAPDGHPLSWHATGLPTAVFHSDYSSNVRPGKAHPQPFLEFYHAGTLPILIAHDVRLTSVGHARNDYFALAAPGSTPPPHRWSGRPETLAAISGQGYAGAALTFVNYTYELPFFCDRVLPLMKQAGLRLA